MEIRSARGHMEFFQPITQELFTSKIFVNKSLVQPENSTIVKFSSAIKLINTTYKANLTTFKQLLSGALTQNSTQKVGFKFEMTKIAD